MSEAALDPRNSVSVAASAGSGKTWLLTSRVLRLLLEGAVPGASLSRVDRVAAVSRDAGGHHSGSMTPAASASGILALTFTRKAATEMRLRLNASLRAMAQADDARLDQLLNELHLTPSAELRARARALYREMLFTPYPPRLMTLHAFCQDLLGRFALEARVPPGFTLIESDKPLFRQAWRSVQAAIVRTPVSTAAIALNRLIELGFGEHRLEQWVNTFLAHRGDWWAYVQDQADPLAYAGARLREQLGISDPDSVVDLADAPAFTAKLRILLRYLEQIGGTRWLKPERLEQALASTGDARHLALAKALLTQGGTPYKIAENESALKKLKGGEKDHFRRTHDEVIEEFNRICEQLARVQTLRITEAACALGCAVLEALETELARQQALTFTDLEWRAYRLLRHDGAAEWVRYKMDQKINHVLMDEFQDTSPTQWRMLLPLLEDMAADGSERSRSLFIVGDSKQSIYGFRRANPRLLNTAGKWIVEGLRGQAETLNRSRRSAPAIIDFVNAVFESGAPSPLGESLQFSKHETHCTELWGRVELAPMVVRDEALDDASGKPRDPLTEPRQIFEDRRAAQEAAQVAQRIRELMDSRWEVTDAGGARHAVGYGDVLVLARARTHLAHLERALTAAGIPFVGAARGSLLETAEARDLLALLRWLDAPHRDLELAQVLRSPLFSLDDDALIALARDVRAHGGAHVGTWADALARLAPQQPFLQAPYELLQRWRALAAQLPVHDLLDHILHHSGMALRYESALPKIAAARVRTNLGAIVQLALDTGGGRYPSLPRFLRHLEEQLRGHGDAPDEAPPATAGDMVRVMTIHAAKGLEAAAVFLVNSGRLLGARAKPLWVEWPDEQDRPSHFIADGGNARDSLCEELANRHNARDAGEDLNLLYVALTRARQFLHISGFSAAKPGARKSWHDHALAAMAQLNKSKAETCVHANGVAPVIAARPAQAVRPASDPRLRRPLKMRQNSDGEKSAPSAGLPVVPLDAAGVQRGTAIHYLLQKMAAANPPPPASLHAALNTRLNTRIEASQFTDWLTAAEKILHEPPLARFFDPTRYRRAWNEVPVMGTQPGGSDQLGVMDRLVDDGEALWILDYKTHPVPDALALTERYRAQLEAYAKAVSTTWPGRPVHAGLLLTATRSWVPVIGPV